MPKTKFKFTLADGRVATRSSDRPYTHVVVARINIRAQRDHVHSVGFDTNAGGSWDYNHAMSQIKVGERMWPDKPWLMKQDQADEYAKFMADHPDRAAYIEYRRRMALEQIDKQYGPGDVGEEFVKQWSMSLANAQKGARLESHLASVRIAPVDPVATAPAPATAGVPAGWGDLEVKRG